MSVGCLLGTCLPQDTVLAAATPSSRLARRRLPSNSCVEQPCWFQSGQSANGRDGIRRSTLAVLDLAWMFAGAPNVFEVIRLDGRDNAQDECLGLTCVQQENGGRGQASG